VLQSGGEFKEDVYVSVMLHSKLEVEGGASYVAMTLARSLIYACTATTSQLINAGQGIGERGEQDSGWFDICSSINVITISALQPFHI